MKITPREKRRHAVGREKNRESPFLALSDFHARTRFARSTIPEEKWGTTRSLAQTVERALACRAEGQGFNSRGRTNTQGLKSK